MIDSFEHDQSVLVKGDFLCFDGMSEADKFLMEINNSDGIKEYQDEDGAIVLANKDLDTSVETSSSKVLDTCCQRKSGKKRKMSEKMKTLSELDSARKRESNVNEKIVSTSSKKNIDYDDSAKVAKMDSYTLEDMETVLLVYTKKRTVNEMYFSLRKAYLNLKKEEITFKDYTKDLKNPNSHLMAKQVTSWLIDMKKIVIHGYSPLSANDIELLC
ncbi:hypothetical protein GOP47_0006577 [Adiantum capillus-veneris]|uniref:Uncharacterized protein n=1 Tax=Adiantum capillus-veneris TaxID=13818 RepID=A0A9D4V3W1_ADICA|nr:hypothetical protein GOP47_0006577 [Adiantum capillus-veneris]